MSGFDELKLSTETLRELSSEELTEVAGGLMATTTCPQTTQSPVCPSGATWFAPCGPDLLSRNC